MPGGITRSLHRCARYACSALFTAAVWTVWLALVLLLAAQVYVASVKEMQVPPFLLHAIEERLAKSGVSVSFGRAVFDPTGRLLLEKASFKLASFTEPIVTADAIYIRVDPWALFERQFEPREIRATGANLFIPAMLSASGRAEKVVQDLDAGFSITSRGDEFSVDYLNCRLGGMCLSAHGAINAGTVERTEGHAKSIPLAQFIARNYVALSREFSRAEEQLGGLDQAVVTAVLTPSDTRGALVSAELRAAGLRMAAPVVFDAEDLQASARFPLLGNSPLMTAVVASVGSLKLPGKADASELRVRVRGILNMDTFSYDPKQVSVTAARVTGGGVSLMAPIARIVPQGGKAFSADVTTYLFGRPIAVSGRADLAAQSAEAAFEGTVTDDFLPPASARIGADLRQYAGLTEPVAVSGRLRFGAGWKFQDAQARVDARNFTAYHVHFDEARGFLTFDGTHLLARDAVAWSGDNHAEGSYQQNLATRDFRYLLNGRLRPLDIMPWFAPDAWPTLFRNADLTASPPDSSVDVHGRYAKGRVFSVFIYADAKKPGLRGIPFERVRALVLVNQFGCYGFEVVATQEVGTAQGSFLLATEPITGKWTGLDLDLTSTVIPGPFGRLLPAEGEAAIAAFSFDQAPSLKVVGHLDNPAADNPRKKLLVEARADAGMRLHGVAFDKATFKFELRDSDIDIQSVQAAFAGGTVTGTALVSGSGPDRSLRFKASLSGGSLGLAAAAGEGYVMSPTARASTALAAFARDKSSVRLDLNVSAEGRPSDLETFVGDGNFQIQGAQLGQVSLLGGLSKVLKFPELRFTQARAVFKIDHANLIFPELSILGANSAVKAKGSYAIDRRQLDFSATIYPFLESKSFLQVLNVTAPLSAFFRVKLTGSIDKPSWTLAYSPLSLFRSGDAADKPVPPSPLANPVN